MDTTLNLPNIDQLLACENLLIAGIGGGFDLFCGLPIYFELKRRGKNPHLANLSFSPLDSKSQGRRLTESLVGVDSNYRGPTHYFPELHLSRWFAKEHGEDITIWCFGLAGVVPLSTAYKALAEELNLDGILLIDGGVDAIMRGNEYKPGTPTEDMVSVAAVLPLIDIPLRQIACLGFGSEEDLTHAHALENIAALAAAGGFVGSCALTPQMPAFRKYDEVVHWVNQQQPQQTSLRGVAICESVKGVFGQSNKTHVYGSDIWRSPLMNLYWMFELTAVAERCLFLNAILNTQTMDEAMQCVMAQRRLIPVRPESTIPLI